MISALLLTAMIVAPFDDTANSTLVDCSLQHIDFATRKPVGDARRLVVLFPESAKGLPSSNDIKVFDPGDILSGMTIKAVSYREDGKMMFMSTDTSKDRYFKFAASPRPSGRWAAGLGLNGSGSAEDHMAQSYMGECAVGTSKDNAAQFEALR